MTAFITNYLQDTAMNLLATGLTAAGNVAGNAVGGVGQLIENGGRSAGDGVANSIKQWGDYINSYGDQVVRATAASDGSTAVKKTAAVKPSKPVGAGPGAKKALPAPSKPKALPAPSAQKALPAPPPKTPASSLVQKALPSAGDKLKALPAPPSSSQGAKKTISAASKPKPAGSPVSGLPKAPAGPKSLSSVPKPPTGPAAVAKSAAPSSLPKPPAPKSVASASSPDKVKISPESRPKPAATAKGIAAR